MGNGGVWQRWSQHLCTCQTKEVSHSHIHARGRRHVYVCVHTHTSNRTRVFGSLTLHHPWSRGPSPAWCHQPPHPWIQAVSSSQLELFKLPLGARPREEHPTPRASPAVPPAEVLTFSPSPMTRPLPWGERGGCCPPSLPPPGDAARRVSLSRPRLHVYFVLTSGNQERRTQSCTFQVAGNP